jgi:hypothetical protein
LLQTAFWAYPPPTAMLRVCADWNVRFYTDAVQIRENR